MKSVLQLSMLLAALVSTGAHAGAGTNTPVTVTISEYGSSAEGAVARGHAYYGSYIRCGIEGPVTQRPDVNTAKVVCEAKDANGTQTQCEHVLEDVGREPLPGSADVNDLLLMVAMINKSSEISFQGNAAGICTSLEIINSSYNLNRVW